MLNRNNSLLKQKGYAASDVPIISAAEKVLISLGGLLHDISHGPFSHDIEKKTHHVFNDEKGRNTPDKVKSYYGPYEKHDNYVENPALYVMLMDSRQSLLARVLRKYSPAFYKLLLAAAEEYEHVRRFTDQLSEVLKTDRDGWDVEHEILPSLLFHLLFFEKPEEAQNSSPPILKSFDGARADSYGLGPAAAWKKLHEAWYQPYRHDIIGDTLSADLIDYLMRDQARLGMKGELDDKLLNFYVLVPWVPEWRLAVRTTQTAGTQPEWYRPAIDLNDHKRGTFRAERLNDIFRLLDLRHQIHEKAVYHRVVQSAIAMLSRACLTLGDNKPKLKTLYGYDEKAESRALAGDDHFLEKLIETSLDTDTRARRARGLKSDAHRTLIHKLAERRVYRPLMVVPGDRVPLLLHLRHEDSRERLEFVLRQLAAITDSTFFSQFFLLVSKLIELLLQHGLDTEDDVYAELEKLVSGNRLGKVTEAIPKRVIFWTMPYKQLYKDPGILVRVNDGLTTTIDRLKSHEEISKSLSSRIEAGIRDAETKNEALWKFYVFISDSLFYTGVLAKILPGHPCQDEAHHQKHLQIAKSIVARAINSAWEYWTIKECKVDLNKQPSSKDVEVLIQLFQHRRVVDTIDTNYERMLDDVSGVQVSQYLHGDDSPKCRDVRYKFDAPADFDAAIRQVVNGEERNNLEEAYKALGLDNGLLDMEEMVEVLTKLHKNTSKLPKLTDTVAARGLPFNPEVLRSFWNDLD